MQRLLLAFGGNVGDVKTTFEKAKEMLDRKGFRVVRASLLYETEPIGPDQDWYLNQVVEVETVLSDPEKILDITQFIETALGRKRDIHWGPRTLDIDILFMGDLVYESDRLMIPHRELHKRSFVLVPLKELWPDLVHPVLKKDVETMLAGLFEEERTEVRPHQSSPYKGEANTV